MVYSDAGMESLLGDGFEETIIEGIIVSAIAIKVVHCEAVRTSPSGGGGRGLSKGASRLNSELDILQRSYSLGP